MKHSTVIYWENALTPQHRTIEKTVGKSLRELAPSWDRPHICLVDGQPVLRRDWDMRVYGGRVVVFVDVAALPQGGGGGGSNPLRMVAMLAVVALAIYAPYAAPATWGLTTTVAGVTSVTMTGAMVSAGVMIAGTMLVNAVLPAQAVQSANSIGQNTKTASPTYSLQAQGNTARLEAAIPEHFGRIMFYADFASQPYQEYAGNEQYLYQFFCLGRGHFSIEGIYIEDTALSNFEDVEYEVIGPNEQVTLMPVGVITANEVAGNEMDNGVYVGPFVANPGGTAATIIGIDFVCLRGLYYANDNGSLSAQTVTATIEAREIDDNGDPVGDGSYTVLGSISETKATTTPQRFSYRYTVDAGRYEVRVKRTNAENTGTRYGHEIVWGGLRAYLKDVRTYGDTTCIAMRMRASSQLTSISSRKIRTLATRKLPIWNGSTWSSPQPTRSIAWAAAYTAKQVGLTDQQIDLATLLQLDAIWSARGDYADGRFDNFVDWWSAMTTILSAGRARHFLQAGVLRFFRDQPQTTPVYLFTMRNILKGSFSVDYIMPTDDTADAVRVTYFDSAVWVQRKVQAKLPDSAASKPANLDLSGIVTGREHAFREGMAHAASNRYRRKMMKFSTEMEGFIPSLGDLIAIQHDVPAWGQSGEIVAWDAGTLTVTCSEPLEWETGETHYIAMRDQKGAMHGPYAVTAGVSEYQAVLAETPAIEPYTGSDAERTQYRFGWTPIQYAIVLGVRPRSHNHVEIEAVGEDARVHTAEEGQIVPVAPTSQLANYTAAPSLAGLTARSDPGDVSIMILSWEASPWADHYLIEASADGTSWTRLAETSATNFTARAIYGNATLLRVAAVGSARGPWVTIAYGDSADYMWNANDATLMWDADDTTLMWRY